MGSCDPNVEKKEGKMKKIVVLLLTIAVISTIIVSGCTAQPPASEPQAELPGSGPMQGVAVKPDGSPYTFGYAPMHMFSDWMVCSEGLMISLVGRAGGELVSVDCAGDPTTQMQIIESFVAEGKDGIVVHPADSAMVGPVCDDAWAAGVPVFNFDMMIESENIVCAVDSDQVEMGRLCAGWLVEEAERTGKHIYAYELWGTKGMEGSERRSSGFHEVCEESPLVDVVAGPDCGWKPELAAQSVVEYVATHPETNAFFEHGIMSSGIIEGLQELGMLYPAGDPGHLYVVPIVAEPATVANLREGYIDGIASQDMWEYVDPVTKAMLANVCCGQSVPSHVTVIPYFITAETIDTPRWGAPKMWCDMFTDNVAFDDWPLLELPDYLGIVTPTVGMKAEGY